MARLTTKSKIQYIFENNKIVNNNLLNYEQLQSKYNKLQLHYQISQILLKIAIGLKAQLQEVIRILSLRYNLLQGNIYFKELENDEIICYASYTQELYDTSFIPLKVPDNIINVITEKKELVNTLEKVTSYYFPIKTQNEVIGVLEIYVLNDDLLSLDTILILKTVCAQLGAYIKEYREFQNAQRLAITDGLTGLYNHRYLQEYLDKSLNSCYSNISLLILDIDFFKKVNDNYGHLQGDRVLLHISNILKKSVRNNDFIARYGGEEFAIIILNTPLNKVEEIAECIRSNVEKEIFYINNQPINITVSIGLAYLENPQITQKQKLIEVADKLLYNAKNNGKNRVYKTILNNVSEVASI